MINLQKEGGTQGVMKTHFVVHATPTSDKLLTLASVDRLKIPERTYY